MVQILLMILAAFVVFGQSPEAAKTFEVASIKTNLSGSGNSSTHTDKGQIRMEDVTLKQCIETAFDVKDYSLSGPPWLDNLRFDILAKLPSGFEPASSLGLSPDIRETSEPAGGTLQAGGPPRGEDASRLRLDG